MKGTRIHRMRRGHGFALVLALVLMAMLATTSVGLGMLVSTEAVRSGSLSRDLDHKLAIDSLIAVLPRLLAQDAPATRSSPSDGRRVTIDVGRVHVECDIRLEGGKQKLNGPSARDGAAARLVELARANGLPERSVSPRPVLETEKTREWPKYLWFDQMVAPREFEEVFRWRRIDKTQPAAAQKRVWSDLVTFWDTGAQTRSLEVTTRIKADTRRWYLVVDVSDDGVRTVYRGAI